MQLRFFRDDNSSSLDTAVAGARSHRDAWLKGYRRQLGFATLVLHDVGGEERPEPVRPPPR